MVLHWSTAPFHALYDAISCGDEETQLKLTAELMDDLTWLLTVKKKSEASRKILESGEIKFTDDLTYKLNKCFIEDTIKLSDELDIDEIVAAEIYYYSGTSELTTLGTSFLDSAIAAYYNRRNYILQITSFYLSSSMSDCNDADMSDDSDIAPKVMSLLKDNILASRILELKDFSINYILKSFEAIESELQLIKQSVQREKILGDYQQNSSKGKNFTYRRKLLFSQYQILGEIFYGYVKISMRSNAFSLENFDRFLKHVLAFESSDNFSLYFIPALFTFTSQITELPIDSVKKLHSNIMQDAKEPDTLASSPLKSLIYVVFLTNFIDWCRQDSSRKAEYDFTSAVDEPIQKCISLGAFEQLLTICADSSLIEKSEDHSIKPFYDFRSFLQQHVPRLFPIRLFDIENEQIVHAGSSMENQEITTLDELLCHSDTFNISNHFTDLLVPCISNFVNVFISNCAFFMAQLRDAEEDLLLSSEEFNLEELTESADLERLYLSIYYLYSERKEYAREIWSDTTSAIYGFLQWASRCNSPLLMSTFSMLLAGLATGEENAVSVFTFLQLTNSKNTNIISDPRKNSTLLTRYSSISWATIYSTLGYYDTVLLQASDLNFEDNSSSSFSGVGVNKKPLVTELGEDSIIYISGFFQVLSQVARNSSKARIELLESDNHQLFTILTNLLRMTKSLDGPILTLLSSLVGDSLQERNMIWKALDNWIFQKMQRNFLVDFTQETFSRKLTDFQTTAGFVNLLSRLLQPLDISDKPQSLLTLCFPDDLGSLLRRPGVWCYIDYLCTSILPGVERFEISFKEKSVLKVAVLKILNVCLDQLDPELIPNASACKIKELDSITKQKSIIRYIQSNPGSAVLYYMSNGKTYESLFHICRFTIDQLNEREEESVVVKELQQCLFLIHKLMNAEEFLVDELIPILRLPDNLYIDPTSVSASGLLMSQSFMLNLPVATNIFLYAGSEKSTISCTSISILQKLYASKIFKNQQVGAQATLSHRNRLLVMCETVDESIRIKSQFIELFENNEQNLTCIPTKLLLLEFINRNFSYNNENSTISHFLLGFDSKTMTLGDTNVDTMISSERSLLKSILVFIKKSLVALSTAANITFNMVRSCSLSLEIILKLCKCTVTGKMILKYLRTESEFKAPSCSTSNFILSALETVQKNSEHTLFDGEGFESKIDLQSGFSRNGRSMRTLNEYVSFKSYLIELISLELNSVISENNISLKTQYLNLLINSSGVISESSKIFDFLQILEYRECNAIEPINSLFSSFDFEYLFKKITSENFEVTECVNEDFPFNMKILDKVVDLYAKITPVSVESLIVETKTLKQTIACSISYDKFKSCISHYLVSWSVLTQIIVSILESQPRKQFVFEVFQAITSKLDDYLNYDILLAETLVSLCVRLIHTFNDVADGDINEETINMKTWLYFQRISPLFKVSICGIGLPYSTPSIRSDFYIFVETFLETVMENTSILNELSVFLKSLDSRISEVICHDSLIGEGSNRMTSLLLLTCFVKVLNRLQSSTMQENLLNEVFLRGNYLSLLIGKLKVIDDIFLFPSKLIESKRNSLNDLIYELTYFKSILSFLIALAKTPVGAKMLIRNGVLDALISLKFLKLDEDLGMDFYFSEDATHDSLISTLALSLDKPAKVILANSSATSDENISLYNILTPVFQLVITLVITSGPENSMCIHQARKVEAHFSHLISAVLKRSLVSYELHDHENSASVVLKDEKYRLEGLDQLSKTFALLHTLIY